MGQLRIVESRQGISGSPGAVRVNPNIKSPLARSSEAGAQALSNIGGAISGIGKSINEFQEKQQFAKNTSATNSGDRDINAELSRLSNDYSNRNDSENFLTEFDKASTEAIETASANKFFDTEGKNKFTEGAKDRAAAMRIRVEGQVSRKEQDLMLTEYDVTLEDLIKSGDDVGARAHIQDSFSANITGVKRLKQDTDSLDRRIDYANLAAAIEADFGDTDRIVKESKVDPADAKKLKAWGNREFQEIQTEKINEFTGFAEEAIANNDFNVEEVEQEVDGLVSDKVMTKAIGQKWKNRFNADVVDQTSELNTQIMNSLSLEMRTNKNFKKQKAIDFMLSMKGDITQENFSQFMGLYDRIEKDQAKGVKFAEDLLYGKINDLRKDGTFQTKILGGLTGKRLVNRSDEFNRLLDEKTVKLLEKVEKGAAGSPPLQLQSPFSFAEAVTRRFKKQTPEERAANIKQINIDAANLKAAFSLEQEQQFNNVMKKAEAWIKLNPDANEDQVQGFFNTLVTAPRTLDAYTKATQ